MKRAKGFFVVWIRLWRNQQDRPWWKRGYWTTVNWNRLGRGKHFKA